MRANEKFSGKGHARHLCKECARLGKEELDYRQAVHNLGRLVTWEGFIPRKKRVQFNKYLEHENERVRTYALELEVADALKRAEQRLLQDLDDSLVEQAAEEYNFLLELDVSRDLNPRDDTDIPF
jgi:hypothetical protein